MDRETIQRLKQMLARYQRELIQTTDAKSQEALNKLIDDVRRQLARHGTHAAH